MATRIYDSSGARTGAPDIPNVQIYDSDGNLTPRYVGEGFFVRIVGVEWNQGTDTWTRIEADGTEWAGLARADFDGWYPWAGLRRVNLATDGTINAVDGDEGYAENGTNGRVMVQIPKFWVKSEYEEVGENDVYRWWIANYGADGFEVHPLFNQGSGGSPADYAYIGAYEADGYDDGGTFKAHSRSGYQPMTGGVSYTGMPNSGSMTIIQAREYCQNVGTDWQQETIWDLSVRWLLPLIEYGNADMQSNIGRGVVDLDSGSGFAGENTGADSIDSQLSGNGTGSGTGADGETPIAYRWIENPWGNTWTFIDGYEAVDAEFRILKADGSWTNIGPSAWGSSDYDATTATPLTDDDGYISNIEYESVLAYLLIPAATSGGSSTHIPDYHWSHDNGDTNILLAGGHWHNGSGAGLFYLKSPNDVSLSNRRLGSRLKFIG